MGDAIGHVFQAPGDDDPAVGEPDQDDVVQVLVEDHVGDVGDVRGEAHLRARQVGSLADPGQARGEHDVTGGGEETADVPEAVRPFQRSVDQHERRHAPSLAAALPATSLGRHNSSTSRPTGSSSVREPAAVVSMVSADLLGETMAGGGASMMQDGVNGATRCPRAVRHRRAELLGAPPLREGLPLVVMTKTEPFPSSPRAPG